MERGFGEPPQRRGDALEFVHPLTEVARLTEMVFGGRPVIGVANTMVISVLERRAEIGLRRALGATRGHIRLQLLTESQLLSALGGVGGALTGTAVTAAYARFQGWPTVVPAWATGGAVLATLVIGGCAGIYPAWRAARLSPTEALGTP
jgi:putative ABC transport system permease protein